MSWGSCYRKRCEFVRGPYLGMGGRPCYRCQRGRRFLAPDEDVLRRARRLKSAAGEVERRKSAAPSQF